MFENYDDAVTRLQSTIPPPGTSYMHTNRGHDFFLERTRRLFQRLGNPQLGCRVVHVTGTSGKGSTAAMIASVLHAAGKTVGLTTSPFVTTSIENIQINGELVDPDAFVAATNQVMTVYEEIKRDDPDYLPSYSELFFAIGVLCVKAAQCEWFVVEVGCGGRFDYSNIFPEKEVVVITNVGKDHMEVLGHTVEEIAWHKAGIIVPKTAVFSAEQHPPVRRVLDTEADRYGLHVNYVAPTRVYRTDMVGEHQQWNGALAGAVGKHLGIDERAIENGIAETRLPARVELMQDNPRVILDGAHSVPKIQALVACLHSFQPWGKLHLIFAAKEDKHAEELLGLLTPVADTATLTSFQLPGFGSWDPGVMASFVRSSDPTTEVFIEPDVQEAVGSTLQRAAPQDLVLITGSLYMAGFARQYWIQERNILGARSAFPT